jgi:hypothetical protein
MRSETMYCSDRMPDHVTNYVQLYERQADNMSHTVYCLERMAYHVLQVMCYCLDIVAVMSDTMYTTWDITADHVSEAMSVNNWLTLSQ